MKIKRILPIALFIVSLFMLLSAIVISYFYEEIVVFGIDSRPVCVIIVAIASTIGMCSLLNIIVNEGEKR